MPSQSKVALGFVWLYWLCDHGQVAIPLWASVFYLNSLALMRTT